MSEIERETDQASANEAAAELLNGEGDRGAGELNEPEAAGAEAERGQSVKLAAASPLLRLVRDEEEELDEPRRPTPDSEIGVYVFKSPGDDQRKHRRFRVSRPGKVFRRSTQQFQSVESRDLSFSGARLSIVTLTPYRVGEIVDLGLAMTKSSVVPSKSLLQGIVVRAEAISQGRQEVAVRYIPTVAKAA